jgi:hypothetical protein
MNVSNTAKPQAFRPSVRAITRHAIMALPSTQEDISESSMVEDSGDSMHTIPRISSLRAKRHRSAHRSSESPAAAVSFATHHDA